MPFKYAIGVVSERVKPKQEWEEWSKPAYQLDYHQVPKHLADTHDNGFKMLVSVIGEPISEWVLINRKTYDLNAVKRASKATPLKDMMGSELQVGDYIAAHLKPLKKRTGLVVCEVIGFVKQGKIRVLPLIDEFQTHGVLVFPTELVQIPSHLLGADPNEEWIPTLEEDII